jgi:predicted O-linked N-acetylglucosamine transferase (SPINDLY family)
VQQLRQKGDLIAAIAALRTAIQIAPDLGEAHNDLGGLLRERGEVKAALASFREAVRTRPKLALAWFNLGTLLRDLGELEEAVDALTRSLALDPKQADAFYWLGNAWMGRGDAHQAEQAYRAALRVDAQMLVARWALTMAQIEPVPASLQAAVGSRENFTRELDKLIAWCRSHRPSGGFAAVGATQPYYLAYQEQSNVELLRKYGHLCTELMKPWEAKVGLPVRTFTRAARCRVGIVSAHFTNHSVWNAIVRGWMEHLDPSKIELHLFHIASHHDGETAFARQRAHRFESAQRDWSTWAKAIVEHEVDVLVFPEVGMDAVTAKLAAARLAKVQVATWGHPETTGLPSIDHFVSASAMEPAGAAAHYVERLTALPGLGCCARRFAIAAEAVDLRSLGIAPGTTSLLCPGVPFKYAAEHDFLWVEIARRLSPCRLIFFRGQPTLLAERLETRLRGQFGAAGLDFDAHVVFLPWQSHDRFFGLMKSVDVFLDSPGFSGFNTAMQAVECGLPIVAWEGKFLRGRFASAILRELGLDELVADSASAYVDAVLRLAQDLAFRKRVRATIEGRGPSLFANPEGARSMQRFLLEAAA